MFPDQGGYTVPSFSEKADIIRSEFDVGAPKLRLSIFAYLVEAGIKPADIETTEAFMELLAHVTEYVAAETTDYSNMVEGMEPNVTSEVVSLLDDIDGENPYKDGEGGYR